MDGTIFWSGSRSALARGSHDEGNSETQGGHESSRERMNATTNRSQCRHPRVQRSPTTPGCVKRLAFFHIPKTGGRAVMKKLREIVEKQLNISALSALGLSRMRLHHRIRALNPMQSDSTEQGAPCRNVYIYIYTIYVYMIAFITTFHMKSLSGQLSFFA